MRSLLGRRLPIGITRSMPRTKHLRTPSSAKNAFQNMAERSHNVKDRYLETAVVDIRLCPAGSGPAGISEGFRGSFLQTIYYPTSLILSKLLSPTPPRILLSSSSLSPRRLEEFCSNRNHGICSAYPNLRAHPRYHRRCPTLPPHRHRRPHRWCRSRWTNSSAGMLPQRPQCPDLRARTEHQYHRRYVFHRPLWSSLDYPLAISSCGIHVHLTSCLFNHDPQTHRRDGCHQSSDGEAGW